MRLRSSTSTAFDLLRQASQNRNRKLREVAADIITNVSGQPPPGPRGETACQFVTAVGRHGDGIDLDNRHPVIVSSH